MTVLLIIMLALNAGMFALFCLALWDAGALKGKPSWRDAMLEELRHIHSGVSLLRKETNDMAAITATMLDQLLGIAEALLDADPNDKATIADLQQQVQALTADLDDFNDPARTARVQSFLDKAAAAVTPPPE